MKILFMNTSEYQGGAAIAAKRLFNHIQEHADAYFLTAHKHSRDSRVIPANSSLECRLRARLDRGPLLFYLHRHPKSMFSPGIFPTRTLRLVHEQTPDIIHLHWVTRGLLSIADIGNIKTPIVWTLHDMWPFTGGCHLTYNCARYKEKCGKCPRLNSKNEKDLSSRILASKLAAWKNINPTIVCPSISMMQRVQESFLFRNYRIKHIPNGLDTGIFCPHDKFMAREELDIPKDKKVILFGASSVDCDENKGAHFLNRALTNLFKAGKLNNVLVLIFGNKSSSYRPFGTVPTMALGNISEENLLPKLYSAADITVVPSKQENLPYVVMESMSCGTPVVAFDIGGIPDMIVHQQNGYLAKPYETDDLANGIQWVLSDTCRLSQLKENARNYILTQYDIRIVARKYLDLYNELLEK